MRRIYPASSEEALRARKLLADWAGEGYLSKEQARRLEQETVCDLRTTNIFLRLVLFLFTLIVVAAAAALSVMIFVPHQSDRGTGVFLLIFAAVSYVAAEATASRLHWYRFGIEESLAVCSIALLYLGMELAFFSGDLFPSSPTGAQFVAPVAAALFSLWVWRRFGLWYVFLAAMIFAVFLPECWTSSRWAQHVLIVALFASGLACVAAVRHRHHDDYLDETYSLAEALLWLGIYLAINLQLSPVNLPPHWGSGGAQTASEFPRAFYWITWVLIWCVPPVVLLRGIRRKDRFVIAAGLIVAVLTLATNKPYLGWQRHTWDPMLLGILLTGVAWFLQRWLTAGPGGIRHGFTAARLSGKDKRWMSAGAAALGVISPQAITPAPQSTSSDFRFGGGASGGGGAGGDF